MMFLLKNIYMLIVCLCIVHIVSTSEIEEKSNQGFNYFHYETVLMTFVDDEGMVNYSALKRNSSDLNAYIEQLAQLDAQEFETWSEYEQLAFWINAYNGITLKVIIEHYPIKASWLGALRFPKNSIRQIDGAWTKITYPVMGRDLTLDAIEHDTIRVDFDEPRIHFAVNCASIGCPKLRGEPYLAERLDEQLDDQVDWYVNTPDQFKVEEGTVYLSKILDWYGDDFVEEENPSNRFDHLNRTKQAVMNFLYPYLNDEQQQQIVDTRFNIRYLDYDWTLNEIEGN